MSEQIGSGNSYGQLGRDVGLIGRWVRLLAGGALAGYVAVHALREPSISGLTELALYAVATLGVYTLATHLLGRRLLANANPWFGTAIFLGPLAAIFALQLGPQVFHHALLLYIGISLIFNFFMRYGGCEVMSIPSLLLGIRCTVYCPLNAVDVVEKAVVGRRNSKRP